jgi:hypothetical protein
VNGYRRHLGVLAGVAILVGTAAAGTLPVSYLLPDKFVITAGGQVSLRMESGTPLAAQTVAWPADKLSWFFIRADGTQENRDRVEATDGAKNATAVTVPTPGVTVIGADLKPAVTQVTGAELSAFLIANVAGAAENPAVRRLTERQKVRMRRTESATTMVRVPAGDERDLHSAVAQSKTGQAVEIRPLFDPTMLKVGADFPVRVYVAGTKQSGAKVQATSTAAGATEAKRADSSAATSFTIGHAGVWRIEFHHAELLENDAEADWAVYSTTLTFEVPAGGGK